MSFAVTLGKIVTVSNENKAKELFRQRKERGIGGIIFTPDIIIPKWTDEEKIELTKFFFNANLKDPYERKPKLPYEWAKAAGQLPESLIALSYEFNISDKRRTIRFLHDDDTPSDIHRDSSASDGWVHLHVAGEGMMCANPVGAEAVQVKTRGADREIIDVADFNKLVFTDRKIEIITLKQGQAIVFDDSMVHFSGTGPRFRAVTFD